MDVWGPYSQADINTNHYFLTIVDDASKYIWVFLMKTKLEVSFLIPYFCQYVKNQFQVSIKQIRTGNGTEFMLHSFFAENGIMHQNSCVYTPQQNGVVERKRQHILNAVRALLFHAHMPISFWGSAVLTASYLINRIPSPKLANKTPFELMFHKPPSYTHLKSFGCLCYALNLIAHRIKFDSRARRCVFIGYPSGVKGYKLYDLEAKVCLISRDVTFHEDIYPLCELNSPLTSL